MDLEALGLLGQKIEANFDAIVRRSTKNVEPDLEKGKLQVYINLHGLLMEEVERYLDYELDGSTINYADKDK